MYLLTASEIAFIGGLVFGGVASLALLAVPLLRRALPAGIFPWLAWRLHNAGPQQLGDELLGYVRAIVAQGDFVRGCLLAKGGVGLAALLLRRGAG